MPLLELVWAMELLVAGTSFSTETRSSRGVSLGDLNNDGILDLVTAGGSATFDGYATVRLGTGTGSFGAATSYVTEDVTSTSLVLGDINGDGILESSNSRNCGFHQSFQRLRYP